MINYWKLYSPYTLFLSALIFTGLALYVIIAKLIKKADTIKVYIILQLLSNTIWLLFYVIDLISTSIEVKKICTYGIIIMNIFVPVHWLFYAFHSSLKELDFRVFYDIIFSVILVAVLILISTNNLHHFFWYYAGNMLFLNPGFLLMQIFNLVILLIGGIFLLKNLSMPFYIFRWQAFAIFFAVAVPLILIVLENFMNVKPAAPLTLVPYSFVLSTWVIRLTKTRYGNRDIIAVSRGSYFENTNDIIVVLNKFEIIVDINPAAKLMINQDIRAVLEKPINEVWPELAEYLTHFETKNEKNNYMAYDTSNKKHFFDIAISLFPDWEHNLLCKIIVLHDITERKNAEENARKSEEKFRNLIQQSIDGIIITDETGVINEWNDSMEKITGVKKETVLNMPAWEVYVKYLYSNIDDPRELYSFKEKILEALNTGNAAWLNKMGESTITLSEGLSRPIQHQAFPIKTSKGYSLGSVVRDITANRQLEIERIKTGKLESLGILAGGIAHDFNNILTAIVGNLSMAKLFSKEDKQEKLLLDAETACIRAKNLTQQLLTFSKGGEPVCQTTSIVDIIKNATNLSLSGTTVKCDINTNGEIWPVDVDIGQMNQVISNLTINAVQAMPKGGTIRISIENTDMAESELFPLNSGKYVKIAFIDEGIGIPAENLSKIFDPYFTTKEKGSGLGLAITYNIIKRHFGYITVDSIENTGTTEGTGTTFTIYLKASNKPIIPEENKKPESMSSSIKLKILIMDDELSVRSILQQMIELIGHSAVTTSEGSEAITAYKQALNSQEPFDIVIMDLTVPDGMGGKDTIVKLLEIDIEVKAIVSSGYSNDPILANYKKYGFKGYLPKPYKLSELRNVINIVAAG